MKKLFAIVLAVLLVSGCSMQSAQNVEEPVLDPTPAQTDEPDSIPRFYLDYGEIKKRPFAIMIDNDGESSRPHAGIEDAYLIYEVPVEGGATRLMALFNDVDTKKIGPVRSSRHYFLDLALEHDAVYAHVGWSPRAQSDIPALSVNNINGILGSDGAAFWREDKYKGDYHSTFTSIDRLQTMASSKSYDRDVKKAPLKFNAENLKISGGDMAEQLAIKYAGFYTASFKYNEETELYKRYINGSEHKTQSGAVLYAVNIIVQYVKAPLLGDGSARLNVNTTSGGSGYYITMGEKASITWEKPSRGGRTVYKDKSGSEITLNPGVTWIMLVPDSNMLTIN